MDFFVADIHGDHRNIIKYCHRLGLNEEEQAKLNAKENFRVSDESLKKSNDIIFDDINSVVSRRDKLWLLGDFCYPSREDRRDVKTYVDRVAYWRSRINCDRVYMIWGNHDQKSSNPNCPKRAEIERRKIFQSCNFFQTISVGKQNIVLCHYAMAIWEQMQSKWDLPWWNLYGHSHSSAEDGLEAAFPGRLSLDVGIDNIYLLTGK